MIKENFKTRVCVSLIDAAGKYKEKYVDYEYLVCSEAFTKKKYYIIDAKEDNFLHLTGVNSTHSPKVFFDKCYNGTLQETDFDFVKRGQDEKSVKGTVRRKIKALPEMMLLFDNPLLVEENFQKNKIVCAFAAADESCTLGFSESEKARPKSLVKGNELSDAHPVDLLLRKKSGNALFDELVIGDKKTVEFYKNKIEKLVSNNIHVSMAYQTDQNKIRI